MPESLVLYHVEERICEITLNRVDKKNALNPELVNQLKKAIQQANNDNQVKVIVLKANGDCFSAGADLAYLQQLQKNTYEENLADSENLKELFTAINYSGKTVIAQVEGHAIAGGCGLATVCDFVFAVPEAKFGYTEVKLGFVPAIVACFLMQKTSLTIAKKLLLTGDLFSAQEALQYNLITYVTKSDEINQIVMNFALDLCNNSSANSLQKTKMLINEIAYNHLNANLDYAVKLNAEVRQSDDFNKGISAFLDKQKIKW